MGTPKWAFAQTNKKAHLPGFPEKWTIAKGIQEEAGTRTLTSPYM
jgi:hypothetical protein